MGKTGHVKARHHPARTTRRRAPQDGGRERPKRLTALDLAVDDVFHVGTGIAENRTISSARGPHSNDPETIDHLARSYAVGGVVDQRVLVGKQPHGLHPAAAICDWLARNSALDLCRTVFRSR